MNPQNPEELAEALRSAAARGGPISLGGSFTKQAMGGPPTAAETTISTAALNRVLQYEPGDLTISVEAGIAHSELSRILGEHRQMLPLDPPFSARATAGGILAANTSGPRRRLYGTARDFVIGMKFATLDGKLIQSGGMVVKNVAGLDMAKLMIGSFGTLAAIAVANFKVVPIPACSRTLVLAFDSPDSAIVARNRILSSVLQPAAIDLLNPQAAVRLGFDGFRLLVQAAGNAAVIERYSRELRGAEVIEDEAGTQVWRRIQDFTPEWLAENPEGAVVRVSCLLTQIQPVMEAMNVAAVARAGSGVVYGYFPGYEDAVEWVRSAARRGWKALVEFAPPEKKQAADLWPEPGSDLAIMERVKQLFDPHRLLNPGRLYGRI